jgi:hypothetical protein
MALGWVDSQLIDPILHFSYFGFEWIRPLPGTGMYLIFSLMIVSSLAIALGWYYRLFAIVFFLCFSYVELIDITYYLNHYYFVSIIAFLMIFVPANRYFSLDSFRKPQILSKHVGFWSIAIIKVQIAIVYFYAGIAKINYDWLFNALPLSIWLPAKSSIPVIGFIFEYEITPYLFSWMGMLFDTFIIVGLLWAPTRWVSYLAVVLFHSLTGILFQIGIFPLIMIFAVTIFFSSDLHQKFLDTIRKNLGFPDFHRLSLKQRPFRAINHRTQILTFSFLGVFFLFQLLFPWRYVLYPGNIFWTEEGYRFAWRVMLMEKAGTATFFIKDGPDGREGSVINHQFLNAHQEKQMAMQPDLILQFAHFLAEHFKQQGMDKPEVRAEVWVTLNSRPAQLLIDPEIDLTKYSDSWRPKSWILPYHQDHAVE